MSRCALYWNDVKKNKLNSALIFPLSWMIIEIHPLAVYTHAIVFLFIFLIDVFRFAPYPSQDLFPILSNALSVLLTRLHRSCVSLPLRASQWLWFLARINQQQQASLHRKFPPPVESLSRLPTAPPLDDRVPSLHRASESKLLLRPNGREFEFFAASRSTAPDQYGLSVWSNQKRIEHIVY